MKNVKFDWITIGILIASFIATLFVYPQIPEIIPRGWNLAGEATGMGSKAGILITLSGITVLYFLFSLIPSFDKSGNLNAKLNVYWIYARTVTLVLLLFPFHDIINALGYALPMNRLAGIAIGAMFIPFGNHMPQLKQNAFVGIRTPWTLRDSDTWKATHKLGGYATVINGVTLILASLVLEATYIMPVCLSLVTIWAIFTVGYSYYYFKAKHKNTQA